MTRVLMIDGNRALTESVGLQCLEHGMAARMTDTFCDGLRQVLETPVSLVIVSSSLSQGSRCPEVSRAPPKTVPIAIASAR